MALAFRFFSFFHICTFEDLETVLLTSVGTLSVSDRKELVHQNFSLLRGEYRDRCHSTTL